MSSPGNVVATPQRMASEMQGGAPSAVGLPLPVAPPRRLGVQARAERVLARSIPQIRYRLTRVGPAGLTGLGVIAAAAVAALALLLPAHRSVLQLRDELAKSSQTVVAPGADERTPQQLSTAMPTRAQIPAVLGVVLVQAAEAGIALDQGKYVYSAATSSRLARYTFEFPVKADYGKIRSFINKSLAAVPALGLEKLHVERKNVGDTVVNADVGFVIYIRGA